MRSHLSRIERLEAKARTVENEGMLIEWVVVRADYGRPVPGDELKRAVSDGVTFEREYQETPGDFMRRVRNAFSVPAGQARLVVISPV